jgi:hypothetical protein
MPEIASPWPKEVRTSNRDSWLDAPPHPWAHQCLAGQRKLSGVRVDLPLDPYLEIDLTLAQHPPTETISGKSMSPQGQHIEFGISESNLFLQLAALGLATRSSRSASTALVNRATSPISTAPTASTTMPFSMPPPAPA